MADSPTVTSEGGSKRVTIPIAVCEELDLEAGEQVADLAYDAEAREVTIRFE